MRRCRQVRAAASIQPLESRALFATYTGTAGIDNYLVRPAAGGGAIEVLQNNLVIDTQPTPVSPMIFNTAGGNDTLTVAASVSASITFGAQAGSDSLILQSADASVTFTPNPAASAAEDTITASAGAILLPGTIDVLSLELTGSAIATIPASGGSTLYVNALSIAESAKLDLNDNDLVTPGAPATTLRDWIISGFGNGPGITSTTGQSSGGAYIHALVDSSLAGSDWPINSTHPIPPGSIIVHYELFGDMNLDHRVTGDDYTAIDANLNTTALDGFAWISGDANLDGQVTGDDYTVIDALLGTRCTTGPTVAMTSPASSTTLSGSVSLTAAASDINGVGSVQFLLDGATLGAADTAVPYSIPWNSNTAPFGTHTLAARGTDLAGNVSTSAPVSVVVDNLPPIALVQSSTIGFENNTTSISRAFPSPNTAGNLLIVTGTAARPAQNLNIADTQGNVYTLALVVTDPAQSVTARIWYCASAKGGANTVTLTPTDGAGHAHEIHISEFSGADKISPLDKTASATGFGTAVSSGAVTPVQNGELIFGYAFVDLSASAGAGFTPLGLINGDLDEYRIQPTAAPVAATFTQSGADDWLAMLATFKRDIQDTSPPTTPTNFTATGGIGSASLTWTSSSDNIGVAGYNIHRSTTPGFTPIAGNLVGQTAATSFTDAPPAAGTYHYRVLARDLVGNQSAPSDQASAIVTADTIAPDVDITAPTSGATVSGQVTVSADASDNVAVAGVQFFVDDNPIGAEDTTAPYSINWTSSQVTTGPHTLTARARDAAGNTTLSDPVNITVATPSGLVMALAFNEGSGTTAADISGSNNNGAISGASWSTLGKYGNALSFDGVNDWVTILDSASLDLTTGMTLEAWINPSVINGWETVMLKETSNELTYALYADNNGNDSGQPRRPGTWIRQGSTSYGTLGTAQLAVNQWTHLAATYDGAALRLYVNGTLASSLARTGSINTSNSPLRLGGNSIWGEWFNGLIDEIRVYNRALSLPEIQSDMSTPIAS